MQLWPYLSRLIHVAMAIVAVGGLFFMWRVALPAVGRVSDPEQASAARRLIARRWRIILWHAIVLLTATGVYNAVLNWPAHDAPHRTAWNIVFGVKMIAAGALFAIGLCLTWPGSGPSAVKKRPRAFLALAVLLAVGVVALASALKMLH